MTNGDGIRQLTNEELAYLICGFMMISKNDIMLEKLNYKEFNLTNIKDNKEYHLLLKIFNERIDDNE